MFVGIGFDVHQLCSGEELVLGGEKIPYKSGLKGHSDADVLTHAFMDALLGAAGAGDIGKHFPDNDDKYKGISSLVLLQEVNDLLKEKNYRLNNADLIVMAEEPKIAPYRDRIINNYCQILQVDKDFINLKATTTEKLGFVGRKEGIAAQAIVSLIRVE